MVIASRETMDRRTLKIANIQGLGCRTKGLTGALRSTGLQQVSRKNKEANEKYRRSFFSAMRPTHLKVVGVADTIPIKKHETNNTRST